jgi:hypothetical protein
MSGVYAVQMGGQFSVDTWPGGPCALLLCPACAPDDKRISRLGVDGRTSQCVASNFAVSGIGFYSRKHIVVALVEFCLKQANWAKPSRPEMLARGLRVRSKRAGSRIGRMVMKSKGWNKKGCFGSTGLRSRPGCLRESKATCPVAEVGAPRGILSGR